MKPVYINTRKFTNELGDIVSPYGAYTSNSCDIVYISIKNVFYGTA